MAKAPAQDEKLKLNPELDPKFDPDEWLPILDADTLDDPMLRATRDRLIKRGRQTKVERDEKKGKVVLWSLGGIRE